MSHELRTPLNAIIGFSEIMESGMFGPIGSKKYREYCRDIHQSGQYLLDVINDILDMSKIEAGRIRLDLAEVKLDRFLDDAIRVLSARADDKQLTLARDIAPGIRLVADQRLLKQVLLNLLSNAVKFTPEGGRVLMRIEKRPDGGITLVVEDSGVGMAAADIPLALQPFTQLDSSLARRYEGTGLGLPLTRSLVELHGGQLQLESSLGEGTTATVLLPARRTLESAGARPQQQARA